MSQAGAVDKMNPGGDKGQNRLRIPEKIQVQCVGSYVQNLDTWKKDGDLLQGDTAYKERLPSFLDQEQYSADQLAVMIKNEMRRLRPAELLLKIKQMTQFDLMSTSDFEQELTTRIMVFPIEAIDSDCYIDTTEGGKTTRKAKKPTYGDWKFGYKGIAFCCYAENCGENGESGLIKGLLILDEQSAINAVQEIEQNPSFLFKLVVANNRGLVRAADGTAAKIKPGKCVVTLPTSSTPFRFPDQIKQSATFPKDFVPNSEI